MQAETSVMLGVTLAPRRRMQNEMRGEGWSWGLGMEVGRAGELKTDGADTKAAVE